MHVSSVTWRGFAGVQRSAYMCAAIFVSSSSSGSIFVGRFSYQPCPMRVFGYSAALDQFSGIPQSRARRMTASIAASAFSTVDMPRFDACIASAMSAKRSGQAGEL